MKHLVAAVATLTLVVSGIVLATSLSSSAQESGEGDTATTTTVPEPDIETFEFGFVGELPAELEELRACLAEKGFEIPEDADRPFRFEMPDTNGLHEALEACGLPGFGPLGGGFMKGLPFDGELPEGFPFGEGFNERFPFADELPEGFDFDGELPEGFNIGGPGGHFEFGFGIEPLDRDALASCLAELGTFEDVDAVRAQLDECLPEHPTGGEFGILKGHGGRGFGGWFDFDLEDVTPEGADASA